MQFHGLDFVAAELDGVSGVVGLVMLDGWGGDFGAVDFRARDADARHFFAVAVASPLAEVVARRGTGASFGMVGELGGENVFVDGLLVGSLAVAATAVEEEGYRGYERDGEDGNDDSGYGADGETAGGRWSGGCDWGCVRRGITGC